MDDGSLRPCSPGLTDFSVMNVSEAEDGSVLEGGTEISTTEAESAEETISSTVFGTEDMGEVLGLFLGSGGRRGWSSPNKREERPSEGRMQQLVCDYFSFMSFS